MRRQSRATRSRAVIAVVGLVLLGDAILRRRSVRGMSEPGLLVVQIDGLGLPALHSAIDIGNAPFLGGLLHRNEVALIPWFALLPPTTPASQAGILHGHNDEIPGFRWYEKSDGQLLVANHAGDAAVIARRQSDGHGLLAPDGASIGNLMTGDARRTYLTMATVAEEPRAPGTLIRLRTFLLSPLNGLRIVAGTVGEFLSELYQGRSQALRHVRPRMHRGFDSATERAVLNGAVRILSTELVMAEMRMGTPVIYVDFTGEDTGLLPKGLLSRLADATRAKPADFGAALAELFARMASGGGMFGVERIDWFNGGLFDSADVLRLTAPEIGLLVEVGRLDWGRIEPAIFGTLFERGLDPAQRTQLGAHYTSRDDIHARVVAAAHDAEAAGSEAGASSAVLW
jgi:hypothetical protein